ncbi:MAG: S8 family serine peptidase, partial [Acidobacteriota bacterium]|nr:S8 family serine peptidase [Acidobacteriota bacterium]
MKNILQFGAIFGLATLALAGQSKISGDLRTLDPESPVEVIVQFKHAPSSAQHQKITSQGGTLNQKFDALKGAHYTIPAKALAAIGKDDEVLHVSKNREVHGSAVFTYDYTPQTVGSFTLGPALGSGVAVAIIDSGITPNADFANSNTGQSRIVYKQSFVSGTSDASDYYGHGTHVAGIIGGNGASSAGPGYYHQVKGVAPSADIVNLRVLDANGASTDAIVIAAIEKAIALKNTYNIRVINLSLGRPVFESYTVDPLCQAVEAAWNAGIAVVVAAGNSGRDNSAGTSGYATIDAPGNDPLAITVGAMKTVSTPTPTDDSIASYSSKGPTLLDHIVKPDLVAPGNSIFSILDPQGSLNTAYPGNIAPVSAFERAPYLNSRSNYFVLSGTSMSAAVVSGASAAMIGQNGALTPDQLKATLMKTASKSFPSTSQVTVAGPDGQMTTYSSQYDLFTVGAGYLNLPAALASSDRLPANTTAQSPAAAYDSKSGNVYV